MAKPESMKRTGRRQANNGATAPFRVDENRYMLISSIGFVG
jgi:hypothetical protein